MAWKLFNQVAISLPRITQVCGNNQACRGPCGHSRARSATTPDHIHAKVSNVNKRDNTLCKLERIPKFPALCLEQDVWTQLYGFQLPILSNSAQTRKFPPIIFIQYLGSLLWFRKYLWRMAYITSWRSCKKQGCILPEQVHSFIAFLKIPPCAPPILLKDSFMQNKGKKRLVSVDSSINRSTQLQQVMLFRDHVFHFDSELFHCHINAFIEMSCIGKHFMKMTHFKENGMTVQGSSVRLKKTNNYDYIIDSFLAVVIGSSVESPSPWIVK